MPRALEAAAPTARQVRLSQRLAVDADDVVDAHAHRVAGQPDQALDEDAAGPARARSLGRVRHVEDDHLAALRLTEEVDEARGDDAVREAGLATVRWSRAMQRRLHRRRRNPVGAHEPGLGTADDGKGKRDRRQPLDQDPVAARQPPRQSVGDALHSANPSATTMRPAATSTSSTQYSMSGSNA